MNSILREILCNIADFVVAMGKYCKTCKKFMKNPQLTHCSDECLFSAFREGDSLSEFGIGVSLWDEKSDPWV